ncbi:dephospho-CoA kinase [Parafrigoribacterium soli]|uniref:dephospho-CoA kinase n=1 Tax=Parafrigoribacterium soli TaxID=3144663 RepID=UPI0032EE2628
MYLIALTGGIASGKSLVSERLAQLGAVIIDADVLARQVVEPGSPALAEIAETFGARVIQDDGSLDRPVLGSIIFQDSGAREKLNAITHPAIWKRTRELIAEAGRADPDAIVVYDVPLLAESGNSRAADFDLTVVVHAETETRLRRLVELRGLNREEAQHRLHSQATDTERLAIADVVIDNNGTIEETLAQVDALWHRIR